MSAPGPDTEILDRVQALVDRVPQGAIVEVDRETIERLRADYCRIGYWLLAAWDEEGEKESLVVDEKLIDSLFSQPGKEHRWALLADGSVIFDSRRVRGPFRVGHPYKEPASLVVLPGGAPFHQGAR